MIKSVIATVQTVSAVLKERANAVQKLAVAGLNDRLRMSSRVQCIGIWASAVRQKPIIPVRKSNIAARAWLCRMARLCRA